MLCASSCSGLEKSSAATSITSGYNGSPMIGRPERRHVHPQLMGAAGAWRQPVEAIAEVLDERFGIRLARLLDRL